MALLSMVMLGVFQAWGAEVASAAAAPADAGFSWRAFLAPFHFVVLHFPIGFLTAAFLLEVDRMVRRRTDHRGAILVMLGLGLATGVIAAAFGLMRAEEGGYDAQLVWTHRLLGLCVPVATGIAWVLGRAAFREAASARATLAYRGALGGTLALVTVTGHFGGSLTHGSGFLVANAPQFVRELAGAREAVVAPGARPVPEVGEVAVFAGSIQPILKRACVECHGAEKHKGDLRLDDATFMRRGGENGPVVVAGDVAGSPLAQRILLPADHDDVMPPNGKGSLKPEEIGILLEWIRGGAPMPGEPEAVGDGSGGSR